MQVLKDCQKHVRSLSTLETNALKFELVVWYVMVQNVMERVITF